MEKSPAPTPADVSERLAAMEQDMLRLMMSINDALSQRRPAREVRILRARLSILLRDSERLKAILRP